MRVFIINGTGTHTEKLTSACTALLGDIVIVNLGLSTGSDDSGDGPNDTPLALVLQAHEQVNDAFRLLDLVRSLPDFARFVRLLALQAGALEQLPTIGALQEFILGLAQRSSFEDGSHSG